MKRLPLWAAGVVLFVHAVGNAHYGFFRDELYFIICGRHPQWGYVDQPALVPLMAASTQMFGHSLFLLRLVPALFAAGGAYVTCLLAEAFGGGAFAAILAGLVFLVTPVLMSFGMKVGTDEVGLVCWPLLALTCVAVARGGRPRLWLAAGAIAGVAFNAKYSVLFFVAALLAGMLLTNARRALWSGWFAGGLAVGVALALPNVLWQHAYGWPMLELLRNGADYKNEIASPPLFALQQLLITNPLVAPVWIAGLVWLFMQRSLRFLAWAYVALIAEMLAFHGKHYYAADVYPVLIASGAVAIERWTSRAPSVVRPAAIVYVTLAGALFVPDVLPILPERTYVAFAAARDAALHIPKKALETEPGREAGTLPGDWADMHGWPELAASAASVYRALPARERDEAVVFAGNFGEASAIAFFEPELPVVSEQNQFWLWGPRGASGDIAATRLGAATLVQVNGTCFHDLKLFGSVRRAATISSAYAIGYENGIPIWVCRKPRESLTALWPSIKDYE